MNSLLKPQKLWYRLHSYKSCLTNLSNEIKTASEFHSKTEAVMFSLTGAVNLTKKEPIDIERMVMQTRYELSLMAEQPVMVENSN